MFVYNCGKCHLNEKYLSFAPEKSFHGRSKLGEMTKESGFCNDTGSNRNIIAAEFENEKNFFSEGIVSTFATECKIKVYISNMGKSLTPQREAARELYKYFLITHFELIKKNRRRRVNKYYRRLFQSF